MVRPIAEQMDRSADDRMTDADRLKIQVWWNRITSCSVSATFASGHLPRQLASSDQLPHVLGQHVGLDVDPVAGPEAPRVVTARVWGMSMTENPSAATSTSVRLTPSTAIEPLGTIRGVQAGSMREGEELPLALGPALAEGGRGVDVPLDEVAAEAVADPERALEVHRGRPAASSPRLVRSRVSGPAWTSNRSPVGRDDRQAAAVDRHALAERQRAPRQAGPGERRAAGPQPSSSDPLDPAQRLDQSREHDPSTSLIAIRSPTMPDGLPARARLRDVYGDRAYGSTADGRRVRIGRDASDPRRVADLGDRLADRRSPTDPNRGDRTHDTAPEPPRLPRPGDRRDRRPGRRPRPRPPRRRRRERTCPRARPTR